jgi:hypothetical protein
MAAPALPHKRWLLWWPLLALAAWLVLSDPAPQQEVVAATRTAPASAPPSSTASVTAAEPPAAATRHARPQPAEPLATLVPRHQLVPAKDAQPGSAAPRDLFSAHQWTPPPPPQPVQAAAPPTAPPVPYAYLGKKQEGEAWEVYLARGEQTFIAREGSQLEGSWRIDQIRPPSMTLTYLPLNQPQTLPIGESR